MICSVIVVPERGIPTTKMGLSDSCPNSLNFSKTSCVKSLDASVNLRGNFFISNFSVQELPGLVEIQEGVVVIAAVFVKPAKTQVKQTAILVI